MTKASDPNKRILDVTNQHTEVAREHVQLGTPGETKFKNGLEAFNALSPMPQEPIELADGRRIVITRWCPNGNEAIHGGDDWLKVYIEGFIRAKEDTNETNKED